MLFFKHRIHLESTYQITFFCLDIEGFFQHGPFFYTSILNIIMAIVGIK